MRLPKPDMKSVSHPYPETTMFGAIEMSAKKFPDAPAYDFMDKITTYSDFINKIETAAKAFIAFGIKPDDAVTICMPNTPQAIICLYALNRIGAVANMVHPLSSQKNITFYIDFAKSRMILTLDQFYTKVKAACSESSTDVTVIVARIQEELPTIKGFLYEKFKNKENLIYPDDQSDITWEDFFKESKDIVLPPVEYKKEKTAVILYSGGTSGTPKGIQLSDYNFNALGMQIAEICGCNLTYGCKFLSVMPIFHGFGLGIGIHTILENGAMCILIPQFTKESYAEVVIKKKPNFIAGVPTLFEALLRVDAFKNADLSFLIGVFSGGDALNPELKKKVDAFFSEHNASVQIREGYGLTECVTASCVTPVDKSKTGSIGLPLRDMVYKIVEPGTFTELPAGEKGEIIISGPTLMQGYMNNEEENSKVLRTDSEGRKWLFTGDLGSIDNEGFVYFHQRIKRMIITSGYNVYPSHIEKILDKHPDIDCSCVIGMPDPYKMQKIRAYISLNSEIAETDIQKQKILDYCASYLDVYEMPQEIIFRRELPKTLVGKVAYHTLEEEAKAESDVLFQTLKELLGTENIDFSDSFLSLGGNSLKAMELKSLLEEKGYDIELARIFNSSDIESLKNELTDSNKITVSSEYSSVMNITHAQHRVYTAQMISPESLMYNMTIAFRTQEVDPQRLENAVNAIIARHESFRTRFENCNGHIMQIIEDSACITVEKLANGDIKSFVRPFDLTALPLIRVGYYENTIVFDMHHIISDGGTLPVFFRELNEFYMGRETVGEVVQYGEFAVMEVNYEQSEKYWLSVFDDEIPVIDLPADFPRTEKQNFEGNVVYDIADINLHNRIVDKCKMLNITPYIYYMACFNILLSKFSGKQDIVVGMPVSGRSGRFLNTVGMFVNTVVLRNQPSENKKITDFFADVRTNSVAALEHQKYPYDELVRKLNVEVGKRNPLFDVMFAYQSDELTDIVFGDNKAELIPVPVSSAKCDFSFSIMPRCEDVVIMVEYCTALYREKRIKQFINAYRLILEQCLDEQKMIKNINVTTEEEKSAVSKSNDTFVDYNVADSDSLFSLFHDNARKNSEKTCIRMSDKSVNYGHLLYFSECLDGHIRSITGNKKSVIAVIAERSVEMYAGIYGILRGGNAYLPVSPDYPEERIKYILENSSAALVVCQTEYISLAGELPCIDLTEFINNPEISENILPCAAQADDIAYVIYTSGSTGNPKGAKISHRSALNRILWMNEKYPLKKDGVILQKTPYTFDVSVWEIFWWGIKEGCLAVSKPGEHFIPAKILDEVFNNQVTHLHFVPSVFELFLKYLESHNEELYKFSSVRHVFLSGEALSALLVNKFCSLFGYEKATLHNLYGPTECAVDVTFYDCAENETDPVPIGKPISNTNIFIVDKNMNIQPEGVKGELCIGGVNVGQGYLGNEKLTEEKFIDNPFAEGKLYKTGDLAYFREDGNIIFCGRIDNQIKLNGQRIEIGEIESVIAEIEEIESVAVVVQNKNGNDMLTAFYCAKTDCNDIIHRICLQKLPLYMIPAAFCRIEKMPLNTSGKLDRKALASTLCDTFDSESFIPPENATEKLVCEAFSKVLGVKNVGRTSNFFALGGTSLSVIALLSEDGFETVSAADVLKNPTPELLSQVIDNCNLKKQRYTHLLYECTENKKMFVLLPFAGGNAESFAKLVQEYRNNNYGSVLFVNYLHSDDECQVAAAEIKELAEGYDLYFYSHCVGSAVAYKIIGFMENDYNMRPECFIIGASMPMSKVIRKNPWDFCPDSFIAWVLKSAGAQLDRATDEKTGAVIASFRKDTGYATEVFSRSNTVLSCPVAVVINKNDMFTKNYKNAKKLWSRYSENRVSVEFIESGSHYFQSDNAEELFDIIKKLSD